MKILVTGFDPFGGQSVNPAYEAVRLLPDQIGTAAIINPDYFRTRRGSAGAVDGSP